MTVGEADEEIAQIGIGFDAVHPACADETGKARPIASTFIVTSKKRISTLHGRTAYGIFNQVGIYVDMAVIKEQPEAVLTPEHIGKRLTQIGFTRDALCLSHKPGKELIHQRPGHFLSHGAAMFRLLATNSVLDLVEGCDAQQRLIHEGRSFFGCYLDELSTTMCPAKCQSQRIAA